MIVVDASIVVEVLTRDAGLGARAWSALQADPEWASVGHLHAEVFSGVRGRFLGGSLARHRAEDSMTVLGSISVVIIDTALLLTRMWELRDDLTGYDAAYVAAAEALDCPLVTADARLAAAPGIRCEVRLAA